MSTRSTQHQTFVVEVMRPVYQTATVVVAADNPDAARTAAITEARHLPEDAWSGQSAPQRDSYDVQLVISESDLKEMERADPTAALGSIDVSAERDIRYALLRADTNAGEGALIVPPWLAKANELMAADIGRDWIDALTTIYNEDVEGFFRGLETQRHSSEDESETAPHPSNVIWFPGTSPPDDDED